MLDHIPQRDGIEVTGPFPLPEPAFDGDLVNIEPMFRLGIASPAVAQLDAGDLGPPRFEQGKEQTASTTDIEDTGAGGRKIFCENGRLIPELVEVGL
jgi:hypothetical protein